MEEMGKKKKNTVEYTLREKIDLIKCNSTVP